MSEYKAVEFKPIDGYGFDYKVSSNGEVWSVKSNKYLKQTVSTTGYYNVTLCNGNDWSANRS